MFNRNFLILIILLLSIDMLYAQVPKLKEDKRAIPSLIPLPQHMERKAGVFELKNCRLIVVQDDQFIPEAKLLQKALISQGIEAKIGKLPVDGSPCIIIARDEIDRKSVV